jgi:hypothetical protein
MGEECLEAGLGRRCGDQVCGTLAVPGEVGGGAGGRVEVSFAIQSDGRWGSAGEGRSQAVAGAHGAGQCSGGWWWWWCGECECRCKGAMTSSSVADRAGTDRATTTISATGTGV